VSFSELVAEAGREAVSALFPVDCAGCGRPDRALCPSCAARLRSSASITSSVLRRTPGAPVGSAGPELRLWSGFEYGGIVRVLLHGFKEAGRADLARPLGRMLRPVVGRAVAELASGVPGESPFLLSVPSSAESLRRRGYNPVELLMRGSGTRLPRSRRLRFVRTVGDQAGLGRADRWANLHGALVAPRSVAGRRILLVDDVVTTGATLFECRRAITAEGGIVVGGMCLAKTLKVKSTSSEFDGDF
jgi:ComF family protein